MVMFNPFCPISAAKIAGLKATIILLLVLLMKSKLLRIKMSLLGSFLGFAILMGFLLSTGVLTVISGGAIAYAAMQNRSN
ncbi:hypothetical protein [Synechococcus sp. MU1611]|uniref:hypothetical protein n=1 Tax=Synechococcus sp. MU1611 TaxID=2508345 RepID=UPI001CF91DE2|nr:hypothetical protein [Synechococcus sp. MU1611]MCB4412531.1 hypothetical protein [Synechococcus sp. MU1611]